VEGPGGAFDGGGVAFDGGGVAFDGGGVAFDGGGEANRERFAGSLPSGDAGGPTIP
jgi:hypothetical protein